jgi:hypothetical protein
MIEATRSQRQYLTTFVVDNPELERLEQILAQFNIFDAIGVARQELRHSDFLSFLLDPKQSHGLGDAFSKRLIQRALMGAGGAALPVTAIDLDLWSLERLSVIREWQNIDILLLDEDRQLAVIIENKIGSGEHSGQLARYLRAVERAHPKKRIVGLYLTPDGSPPSNEAYLSLDYGQVCDVAETLAESRRTSLDPAAYALITHYVKMLRRHVVADSEIAELCRNIYVKHRQALDLIFEHRPDEQAAMHDVLLSLIDSASGIIDSASGIIRERSSKSALRFVPEEWDVPQLRTGPGASRNMLFFEFRNDPERLRLALVLGPGPEPVREAMIQLLRDAPLPVKLPAKPGPVWAIPYSRTWLGPHDYEDTGLVEREGRVRESWHRFLETDLPALTEALDIPAFVSQLRQPLQHS